jgi:2'-5' RNA ligase
VGVALPVPEPWGRQLQALRKGFGEERAAHIPTHVTLLPPTEVDVDLCSELEQHLETVAGEHAPFPVLLRGTGTFRPVSEVVYVQVAQGVSSFEQLEHAIRRGPVTRSLQFPYHPHVTVAHDLEAAVLDRAFDDLADFSCEFTASRFNLYVHHGDEVWRTVREFALTG